MKLTHARMVLARWVILGRRLGRILESRVGRRRLAFRTQDMTRFLRGLVPALVALVAIRLGLDLVR